MPSIPIHDGLLLVGTLAGLIVWLHEARRRSLLDERLIWILIGALVCGALGARLSVLWRYVSIDPSPSAGGFFLASGRSILGGLTGAYAGVLLTKRLVGYRAPTGDVFAPAVALAMAIGRLGCFFTELPGTPSALPWAVSFYDGVPRHPSFLYEILFQLGVLAVLWRARTHVHVPGDLFKIYLLLYAVFRFAVEFVRGNDVVWLGLTRSQLFLIPASLALAAYFLSRRPARQPLLPEAA